MATDQAGSLVDLLPAGAFAISLILCRVGAAVMLLPGLGETELPAQMRAAISLLLTTLILPGVLAAIPSVPPSPIGLLALLAAEIMTGTVLGSLARLVLMAMPVAGQVLATVLGLSSILQPDAAFGAQSTALMRVFGLIAAVLMFTTGLYALPVAALAGSYDLVPPGHMLPSSDVANSVAGAVGDGFLLALRLAAPLLVAGTLWQVMLGVASRLVPQLQVYFVALPGQILGGLLLLTLLIGTINETFVGAARRALASLPGH